MRSIERKKMQAERNSMFETKKFDVTAFMHLLDNTNTKLELDEA